MSERMVIMLLACAVLLRMILFLKEQELSLYLCSSLHE